MNRRFAAIILILSVVFCVFSSVSFADDAAVVASGSCGESATWTLDSNGLLTISGSGSVEYNSSSEYPWAPYTIKKLVVEEGITRLGNYAFNKKAFTTVSLPETLVSIGDGCFQNCTALKGIVIPDSVTSIGSHGLYGCSGLTTINIPDQLISLGDMAFYGCTSLKRVDLHDISVWCALDFSSTMRDCNPIYNGASLYINGELAESIVIPEGVATIGRNVFWGASFIKSLSIPHSVEIIDETAFYNCSNLEDITFLSGSAYVYSSAFENLSSLKSVYVDNLTDWCNITFSNPYANPLCNGADLYVNGSLAEEIAVPVGITELKKYTFMGCTSITSLSIPEGVESIGTCAINNCTKLRSLSIPSTLKSVADYACYNSPLVDNNYNGPYSGFIKINIGTNNTALANVRTVEPTSGTMDGGLTWSYSDGTLTISGTGAMPDFTWVLSTSNSFTTVSTDMPWYGLATHTSEQIKFKSVVIEDGVTRIGNNAFWSCGYVNSLTIPASVAYISKDPGLRFNYSNNYSVDVYYEGTDVQWNEIEIPSDNNWASRITLHAAHGYGEPQWTWSEDYSKASVTFACGMGDDTQTVDAVITQSTSEPSCLVDGAHIYSASAEFNGKTYTDEKQVAIAALGHVYGKPTWQWNDDLTAATAHFACTRCDHYEEAAGEIVGWEAVPGVHTTPGYISATALVTFLDTDYFGSEEIELAAPGHSYGEPVWEWVADGSAAQLVVKCTECSDTIRIDATVTPTGKPSEATCTQDGQAKFVASAHYNGTRYTDNYTVVTPATGHAYGEPEWTWAEDFSKATAIFTCRHDAAHKLEIEASLEDGTIVTDDSITAQKYEDVEKGYTAAIIGPDGKEYKDIETQILKATRRVRKHKAAADGTAIDIDGKTDTLEISVAGDAITAEEPVLLATFDENGRFHGLTVLSKAPDDPFIADEEADSVTIFLVNAEDAAPRCEAEEIVRAE